jgi:ribose 5-phosphate isomerase B
MRTARTKRRRRPVVVAIGSDHAGFDLKRFLRGELRARGFAVLDLGTRSRRPTDYPRYCIAVAAAVTGGRAAWGIVLGGSGQGEQIAANKVRGARAALCNDPHLARLARFHNDANVLALGARIVAAPLAVDILDVWIGTRFGGGRHQRRVDQIAAYERAPHEST